MMPNELNTTYAIRPYHVFDGFHQRERFPFWMVPKRDEKPSPNERVRITKIASTLFQKK